MHENLLEQVLESMKGLNEKLDDTCSRLNGISDRLVEGDRLFVTLQRNVEVCMRGLQTLLLERATKLQVVKSLHEVTEALAQLEADTERDTDPPPTLPTNEIPQPSEPPPEP